MITIILVGGIVPSTSTTFTSEIMGDGLVTGDIVTIPLNPPGDYETYPSPMAECGDDLIDYWVSEGECIEFVLWQINYGNMVSRKWGMRQV